MMVQTLTVPWEDKPLLLLEELMCFAVYFERVAKYSS
jgi:hypothetical protein